MMARSNIGMAQKIVLIKYSRKESEPRIGAGRKCSIQLPPRSLFPSFQGAEPVVIWDIV